jgi:hypothetical protein
LRGPRVRPLCVTAWLHQDIEDDAVLVHGAPEIMQVALNPDEDFIEVPLIAWSGPTAAQAIGKVLGPGSGGLDYRGKLVGGLGHCLSVA